MKKLIIAIGCLTAVILMSSCTLDSVDNSNNENLRNLNQISTLPTSDTIPVVTPQFMDGVDDKDKAKT